MAIRTPSSLQWLIDKRARLHGDLLNYERILARHIKKADKEIEKINLALSRAYERRNQQVPACVELIEKTKIGLRIIDSAIEMHEVKIDPEIIPPIRTVARLSKERYGNLTRLVIDALYQSAYRPMKTKEVASYIAAATQTDAEAELKILSQRVRYRLKNLCRENRVVRVEAGCWILPAYQPAPCPNSIYAS